MLQFCKQQSSDFESRKSDWGFFQFTTVLLEPGDQHCAKYKVFYMYFFFFFPRIEMVLKPNLELKKVF